MIGQKTGKSVGHVCTKICVVLAFRSKVQWEWSFNALSDILEITACGHIQILFRVRLCVIILNKPLGIFS